MKLSKAWLLRAGAVVLVLSNAVVLVGVAYNRQTPPDRVLTLTEREVGPEFSWMWREGENSGLSLRLQYRTEVVQDRGLREIVGDEAFSAYGPIAWLNRDKLAALGFDVSRSPSTAGDDRHYERMLGRNVFLVLELDGPTYARALQAARDLVARREGELAAEPEDKKHAERVNRAREILESEEHERTRLFIVDAGLDPAALQHQYPDRFHYAIVHGNVRTYVLREGETAKLYGTVTAVRCDSINVPLEFRTGVPLDSPANSTQIALARPKKKRPFTVQLAVGRSLEPWIVSAHAGPS